jgi:hypothetical protein
MELLKRIKRLAEKINWNFFHIFTRIVGIEAATSLP